MEELLNKYYNELKDIVFDIYKYNKCSCCAGTFLNISCKYCGTIDQKLSSLIDLLNEKLLSLESDLNELNLNSLPNNKLFNLFMLLKTREIPMLDMLIEQYNYQENYQGLYDSALNKIKNNQELSQLEINALESMIYTNDKDFDLLDIQNYFIRNAMIKGQNVSFACFKSLIKYFAENAMHNSYSNAECIIDENMNEEFSGEAFFTKMLLNESDVKSFYEGKSVGLLFTIGHELQHTHQYKLIYNDLWLSPLIIDEIKEFVIFDYNKEYYIQNHDIVSFEKEAEVRGIEDILKYINGIGLRLSNEEVFLKRKQELEGLMYSEERILNGEVTTVDREFAKVIVNHPEALNKYKQLCFLYKVINGQVVEKTAEDMQKDLDSILANPNLTNEYKEYYKTFYMTYMPENRNL